MATGELPMKKPLSSSLAQTISSPLAPATPVKSMKRQKQSHFEHNISKDNSQVRRSLRTRGLPPQGSTEERLGSEYYSSLKANSILNRTCIEQDVGKHSSEPSEAVPFEKEQTEKEENKEINARTTINRTTPQKPKRKKHRPKVVQEGKLAKTPKPVTPKPTTPKPYRKTRSSARSDGEQTVSTEPTNQPDEDADAPTAGASDKITASNSRRRSIRRCLNFDSECGHVSGVTSLDCQVQEVQVDRATISSIKSTVQVAGMEEVVDNASIGISFDLNRSPNQMLEDYKNLPEHHVEIAQPSRRNKPRENLKVLARRKEKISCINETVSPYLGIHEEQKDHAQSSISTDVNQLEENSQQNGQKKEQENSCLFFPQVLKKRRTMKVYKEPIASLSGQSSELKIFTFKSEEMEASTERSDAQHIWQFGEVKTKKRTRVPLRARNPRKLATIITCSHLTSTNFRDERNFQGPDAFRETLLAELRPKTVTKKRTKKRCSHLTSVYADNNGNMLRSPTFFGKESLLWTCKDVDFRFNSTSELLSIRRSQVSINYETRAIVQYANAIGDMIQRFKHMNMNELLEGTRVDEGVLVPFVGGQIVPRAGAFDIVRKQRPRAKVDLDSETQRVWNLLMGKRLIEQDEGVDAGKEKWWEEERGVFRGRVDSFIARMRLVQGDRHFSQWKGSVVDSVVGVFLTQNVADHLSSSAFMALAAKFPLHSRKDSTEETIADKNVKHKQKDRFSKDSSEIERQMDLSDTQDSSLTIEAEFMEETKTGKESKAGGDITENLLKKVVEDGGDIEIANEGQNNTTDIFDLQQTAQLQGSSNVSAVGLLQSQSSSVSRENSSGDTVEAVLPVGSCSDSNSDHVDVNVRKSGSLQSTSFMELLQIVETNKILRQCEAGKGAEMQQQECSAFSSDESNRDRIASTSLRAIGSDSQAHTSNNSNIKLNCRGKEHLHNEVMSSDKHIKGTNETSSGIDLSYLHLQEDTSTYQETSSESVMRQRSETMQCLLDHPSNSQECCIMSCNSCSKNLENVKLTDTDSMREQRSETMQCLLDHPSNSQECYIMSCNNCGENLEDVKLTDPDPKNKISNYQNIPTKLGSRGRKGNPGSEGTDWDSFRKEAFRNSAKKERSKDRMDSLDWEAVWNADVEEISTTIRKRGMNNVLAGRIKDFLDRLVRDHGSIDLEWLRDIPPDKVKDYLLSIRGLGLKSVECVRLLTLHHVAFPVDTNVGRICVRLGWVPLQPLPESLQLHLLELYPVLETIQKYLWPRLCILDQQTLYELHYHMITFGKVFCTKNKPNCNACPMRGECRHFASAFASARLALPGPQEKSLVKTTNTITSENDDNTVHSTRSPLELEGSQSLEGITPNGHHPFFETMPLDQHDRSKLTQKQTLLSNCEPIIEEPMTPPSECTETVEREIEDAFYEDPDEEIPRIELNFKEFTQNLENYMQKYEVQLQDGDISNAIVALTPEAASLPLPRLKNVNRLRTEHHVYELPDSHPLLEGMDQREPDDPCPYLLSIWAPGETAQSTEPPKTCCDTHETGKLCDKKVCFSCNSVREARAQTVRATLLIPCRTAMRGSFPLNGTYFQVNEVFADHDSSCNPINVPREWIWNLSRRTVYFGTSIPTIFRGLTTEDIQLCFWRGFVCVRGFDRMTRAPKPLYARLHFPATKGPRNRKTTNDEDRTQVD